MIGWGRRSVGESYYVMGFDRRVGLGWNLSVGLSGINWSGELICVRGVALSYISIIKIYPVDNSCAFVCSIFKTILWTLFDRIASLKDALSVLETYIRDTESYFVRPNAKNQLTRHRSPTP